VGFTCGVLPMENTPPCSSSLRNPFTEAVWGGTGPPRPSPGVYLSALPIWRHVSRPRDVRGTREAGPPVGASLFVRARRVASQMDCARNVVPIQHRVHRFPLSSCTGWTPVTRPCASTQGLLLREADHRIKRGCASSRPAPRCQLLQADPFATLPVGIPHVPPMPWPVRRCRGQTPP
jgi:hypothetical protein